MSQDKLFTLEQVEEFGRKAFYDGREIGRLNEHRQIVFKEPTYEGWLRKNNIQSLTKQEYEIKLEMDEPNFYVKKAINLIPSVTVIPSPKITNNSVKVIKLLK